MTCRNEGMRAPTARLPERISAAIVLASASYRFIENCAWRDAHDTELFILIGTRLRNQLRSAILASHRQKYDRRGYRRHDRCASECTRKAFAVTRPCDMNECIH